MTQLPSYVQLIVGCGRRDDDRAEAEPAAKTHLNLTKWGFQRVSDIAETLKKYGGSIWVGFVFIVLVTALGLLFFELARLSIPVFGASLPVIAIGGVVLLILMLAVVTLIFSMLGLANGELAMGLPDGSIRAVIALSLIVLFAILSVFLYKGVVQGKLNTIAQLSDTDRTQFLKEHATLPDLQSDVSRDKEGKPILAKDEKGDPVKNADGTAKYLYDVTYSGTTNAASQDFAKQLLVLLGTLMTAITSFYLGGNGDIGRSCGSDGSIAEADNKQH